MNIVRIAAEIASGVADRGIPLPPDLDILALPLIPARRGDARVQALLALTFGMSFIHLAFAGLPRDAAR